MRTQLGEHTVKCDRAAALIEPDSRESSLFSFSPTLSNSFFHFSLHTSFYFLILSCSALWEFLFLRGKSRNHPLVLLHSLRFLTSFFYFTWRLLSSLLSCHHYCTSSLLCFSTQLPPVSQAQQEVRSWWKWSREEGREREHINTEKIPEIMGGNSRESVFHVSTESQH